MARKKTPKLRVNVKASLSRRLRDIRQEIFGEHGGPELARRLNLPARTWYNYETGVTVPAEVLLGFIEQTGANPMWLLNGEGSRFRNSNDDRLLSELSPVELIRRGLEELENSPSEMVVVAPENLPGDQASEFVAVGLYPLSDLAKTVLNTTQPEGHVMAYRHWLPNPNDTIATRLIDDAMHPILPAGSIVAVDRSVTDPLKLHGQIVAARPGGVPMIRWLDVSGRHVILRPNQNNSREFPLIPVEYDKRGSPLVIGQVVWSWSRFGQT
ncbi:MAG: S24 family peptidase [Isosphaerales bacterium]